MKGRMILGRVRNGESSLEEAEMRLERLEAEMDECLKKMEGLSS